MKEVSTIGIDIAKSVFQVHGINAVGNVVFRRLLVIGATAILRFSRKSKAASTQWATGLLERKPAKVAAVALANKMARIVWALMTKETSFRTAMG